MNRFRKLGYIEYNDRIRVNSSLLNMVLRDELPRKTQQDPSCSILYRVRRELPGEPNWFELKPRFSRLQIVWKSAAFTG